MLVRESLGAEGESIERPTVKLAFGNREVTGEGEVGVGKLKLMPLPPL